MDVCPPKDIHEDRTQRSLLSYCFTPKHHGGSKTDARWLKDLSRPEEFQVFNMADSHQLKDEDGNLYGLRIRDSQGQRQLLTLGTKHELFARFWVEDRGDAPWHGHPLWPIDERQAGNRAGQTLRPPKAIFDRLIDLNLLSAAKARRLKGGAHVRYL